MVSSPSFQYYKGGQYTDVRGEGYISTTHEVISMFFKIEVRAVEGQGGAGRFGEPTAYMVTRDEMFEEGYEPNLGLLLRMLAADAEFARAERDLRRGEEDA
jgi:hypothetical protein